MRLVIFLIIVFIGIGAALIIRLLYGMEFQKTKFQPLKIAESYSRRQFSCMGLIMENLIMPGPLSASHAKYEADCAKCHHAFKKSSQNDLCLSCHKEVAEDLKNHEGLHGRNSLINEKQCKSCHADHKGRGADIVHLGKETFDHNLTDFTLRGSHGRVSITCESCHSESKKYRLAPKECSSCHVDNDVHKNRLGENCENCHKETLWNDAYFDHKKTRFPLEGKHREVTCKACHANEEFKNTPVDCMACHIVNDVHASSANEDCGQCHRVEKWDAISFDHNQKTKFILKGRHAELKCDSCHPGNLFNKNKLGLKCSSCHKADDVHKGKNGMKCESCHSNFNWKQITFDHDKDTHFKLLGQHANLKCASCHKDNSGKMKIDASCYSCHRKVDIHKSQQGTKCELCHNQNEWRETIKFDHDLTSFPLIGLHAVTSCGECHLSSTFKDADTSCVLCHRADDYHKGLLGSDCAKCHTPNGWKLWEFDHNTQTSYKLEGAHEGLECQACHRKPIGKDIQLSGSCLSCHEDDDVHYGLFGQQCDRCHTVKSFKKILENK